MASLWPPITDGGIFSAGFNGGAREPGREPLPLCEAPPPPPTAARPALDVRRAACPRPQTSLQCLHSIDAHHQGP